MKSRQAEAARQALFTYQDLAERINDPLTEVNNGELLAELQAIVALAAVAGDVELAVAAEGMWEAANEGDRAWSGYAPRFVQAAVRVVPEHRRVRPRRKRR